MVTRYQIRLQQSRIFVNRHAIVESGVLFSIDNRRKETKEMVSGSVCDNPTLLMSIVLIDGLGDHGKNCLEVNELFTNFGILAS